MTNTAAVADAKADLRRVVDRALWALLRARGQVATQNAELQARRLLLDAVRRVQTTLEVEGLQDDDAAGIGRAIATITDIAVALPRRGLDAFDAAPSVGAN